MLFIPFSKVVIHLKNYISYILNLLKKIVMSNLFFIPPLNDIIQSNLNLIINKYIGNTLLVTLTLLTSSAWNSGVQL